jgi:hypothetical protein
VHCHLVALFARLGLRLTSEEKRRLQGFLEAKVCLQHGMLALASLATKPTKGCRRVIHVQEAGLDDYAAFLASFDDVDRSNIQYRFAQPRPTTSCILSQGACSAPATQVQVLVR